MKRALIGITMIAVMYGVSASRAQADSFLSINVGATTVSCNTATLAGCSTLGFNDRWGSAATPLRLRAPSAA